MKIISVVIYSLSLLEYGYNKTDFELIIGLEASHITVCNAEVYLTDIN
ncbi:Uncharacterised protein [Corynebacterium kutscheri]|uniref:Uncharacterized protein n=1 Tax=Corynebacterium kutscheri TaxID=35755 RepID=A0A0F6R395_9CORY|nr:hypothetical protein UL82_09955 [Corynebacterium kutscheri]VEH05925.1 Uncharacterised protein [Corynebacterium kutscheri]VEH10471.1 Uncharacterised protein [Corynebacterium kutscheri]VEH81814.1 Uncharacterised protein [Corynebacterium kutscheri]